MQRVDVSSSSSLRALAPLWRAAMVLALGAGALACDAQTQEAESADGDEAPVGKGDQAEVEEGLESLTADGELSSQDVEQLFEAAGDRVSSSEMGVIEAALTDETLIAELGYTIAGDALTRAQQLAFRSNVFGYESEAIEDGISYGGTRIPEAVAAAVGRARLAGATSYDIRELKGDCDPTMLVDDPDHPGEQVPEDCGRWAHYPAGTAPVANLTFEYTELTPEKLDDDVNQGGNGRIGATGSPTDASLFEKISGQTWANNCAILADGSLHCLPSHRAGFGVGLWLTNPALSRCPAQQFSATTDPNGDVAVEVDVEFFRMFVSGFQDNGIVQQLFPERFSEAVDTINDQLRFEHRAADEAGSDAAQEARAQAQADGVTDASELDTIAQRAAQEARTESLSAGINAQLGGLDALPEQPGVDYAEACKHMLWHGHIRASGGRITYLGTSGRPAKRVGEGKDVLADPAPILRAWGFDVTAETVSEHSSVRHASDSERNVLVEP